MEFIHISDVLDASVFYTSDIQSSEYSSRPILMASFTNLSVKNLSYC